MFLQFLYCAPLMILLVGGSRIQEEQACNNASNSTQCNTTAGCAWCADPGSYYPFADGQCYSAVDGQTCCQGTSNGQNSGGFKICNITQTCALSTAQSHYGDYKVASCCTVDNPVPCDGGCYPKGYTCCNIVACPSTKKCCSDGFEEEGLCCEPDGVCCMSSFVGTCCPANSQCTQDYPPKCVPPTPVPEQSLSLSEV